MSKKTEQPANPVDEQVTEPAIEQGEETTELVSEQPANPVDEENKLVQEQSGVFFLPLYKGKAGRIYALPVERTEKQASKALEAVGASEFVVKKIEW